MHSNKNPQGKVSLVDEDIIVKKLTKKQRLKQEKLERNIKMEERRCSLMRQHLERELRYGLYTKKKHEENWRQIILQISLPHHKEELEYSWQSFERLMDAKTFVISRLMDEIRDREEQNMIVTVLHVSSIDRLMSVFHRDLQELHNDFELNLNVLKSKHHKLLDNIINTNRNCSNLLKSMIYAMEIDDKYRERILRPDICSKVDSEIDDNRGTTLQLREVLTLSFEHMQKNTNEILDTFFKKTRKRRYDYEALKTVADKAQEVLANGVKKIQQLNEVIRKLKKKEGDLHHNELANLEGERKFFKRASFMLKMKLATDLKLDKAKMELFVREFGEAYESINKLLKRGVNIMRLLRCTRKLETLEEKTRPYPIFCQVSGIMKQRKFLLFWQRVAKVDASRTALAEERKLLQLENKLLEKKIAEKCWCLSYPAPSICNRKGSIPFTDGMILMRKYET